MATKIYDRRGNHAPTVSIKDIRLRIGRFWKLVGRRGAVGISQNGKMVAVALSLDQFISMLFGIENRKRKKRTLRKRRVLNR